MEPTIAGKKILIPTILLIISILVSCNLPTIKKTVQENIEENELEEKEVDTVDLAVLYTEASLTLEWDCNRTTPIDYFNLYYRRHDSSDWILFESTESSLAEFTINHSTLGDGNWDFGVTSVAFDGAESEMHTSLDQTASPDTGWYITWRLN